MEDAYEPYSRRLEREQSDAMPAVYEYDYIPEEFRNQLEHLVTDVIGDMILPKEFHASHDPRFSDILWTMIEGDLLRELGLRWFDEEELAPFRHAQFRIGRYIQEINPAPKLLDFIEVFFRVLQRFCMDNTTDSRCRSLDQIIFDLNRYFRMNRLGYEFVGKPGIIFRLNSQYIHQEVVSPAIAFLWEAGFTGALSEFMKAHREYRSGDYKDAMNDALKAFESTMKAICDARGWHREENWTAVPLIRAMLGNELVPASLESYFGGIRTILESGVPTLRNKQSGHGQGPSVTEVPDYLAAFTLHLTATNIVFLMSAYEALS